MIKADSMVTHVTFRMNISMSLVCRSASSISEFKRLITVPLLPIQYPPKVARRLEMLYTRLKYHCLLNSHFHRCGIIPQPTCPCNLAPETTFHFLFDCPYYDVPRIELMNKLIRLNLQSFAIPILTRPYDFLDPLIAAQVQLAVCFYIQRTRRF